MVKGAAFFVAGIVVGAILVMPGAAQDVRPRGLNHIGINVRNYEEALAFYTKTLGLREAYTMPRPDGSPLLTYLQASRETFVELIPVGPNQSTGITHFGLEVGDIDASVAHLRQQGVTAADPGAHARSRAFHPHHRSRQRADRGDGVHGGVDAAQGNGGVEVGFGYDTGQSR